MKYKRSDNPYRYTIKVAKFNHGTSNMDVRIKISLPAFIRVGKNRWSRFVKRREISGTASYLLAPGGERIEVRGLPFATTNNET